MLVLAQEEARLLNHNFIGTEHILLGLIREGDGVAPQVMVKLGAELSRVRQQVIGLISGQPPQPGHRPLRTAVPAAEGQAGLNLIEGRLAAVEQRVGTGPDTGDLDRELRQVRQDKVVALGREDYEDAAVLRDRERELLDQTAERLGKWAAAHPDLASLAERVQQLSDEVERLRAVLRQHGIAAEDKPA